MELDIIMAGEMMNNRAQWKEKSNSLIRAVNRDLKPIKIEER